MPTSVALFDCPHCIDEFAFDYHKIAKLAYGWRVRVRCPGCGNIVEVVMLAYTLIHGCDPASTITESETKAKFGDAYVLENKMFGTTACP